MNLLYVHDIYRRVETAIPEVTWKLKIIAKLRGASPLLRELIAKDETELMADLRERARKRSEKPHAAVSTLSWQIYHDCGYLIGVASHVFGLPTLQLLRARARHWADHTDVDEEMVQSILDVVKDVRYRTLALYNQTVAEARRAAVFGESSPVLAQSLAGVGSGSKTLQQVFTIRRDARTISYGPQPLRINQHAHFAILSLLIEADQGIVEYAALLRAIKPNDIAMGVWLTEAPPDVKDAVKAINAAMADLPIIARAVRGKGYQLIAC